MLSSYTDTVLGSLGKQNSSPSERGEPLIFCQEGIVNVPSLGVQRVAGDAILNCDHVFTLIFTVIHFSWSFAHPKCTQKEGLGSRRRNPGLLYKHGEQGREEEP